MTRIGDALLGAQPCLRDQLTQVVVFVEAHRLEGLAQQLGERPVITVE